MNLLNRRSNVVHEGVETEIRGKLYLVAYCLGYHEERYIETEAEVSCRNCIAKRRKETQMETKAEAMAQELADDETCRGCRFLGYAAGNSGPIAYRPLCGKWYLLRQWGIAQEKNACRVDEQPCEDKQPAQ